MKIAGAYPVSVEGKFAPNLSRFQVRHQVMAPLPTRFYRAGACRTKVSWT